MPIYKVENPETGQVVEFDWADTEPPTDSDIEEVFASAQTFKPTHDKITDILPEIDEGGFSATGIPETAATLATGAVAEPVAGIGGILASIAPVGGSGSAFGEAFAEPSEIGPAGAETGTRAIEAIREAGTFEPRTEVGKETLQATGQFLEPVARVLQGAEQFLGNETFEATGSPTLAAAAATLPTAIIEAIGLTASKGFIKRATKTRQLSKDSVIKKAVVEAAPDIEQIKNASRAVYREIDDSGVVIKPRATSELVNRLDVETKKAGINPVITPSSSEALTQIKAQSGSFNSLSDIDQLRTIAQNAASSPNAPDARIGAIIIDNIDSFLDELSPSQLKATGVKASEITPKFKVARELWGRARRSELINQAFEKAKNQASGFENGIVTQFRSIINNKKQSRFFKPKEIEIMQEIVRGTTATNMAKLVGKLGFSEGHATNILSGAAGVAGGAALFGTPGAVAVPVIGQMSKKLAQKLTRGKAEFLDAIVRAGDDAEKIAKAYIFKTSKANRSAAELSELLARPDIALDTLAISKNTVMREAAEIAQGMRAMQAAGILAPAAIKTPGQNKKKKPVDELRRRLNRKRNPNLIEANGNGGQKTEAII